MFAFRRSSDVSLAVVLSLAAVLGWLARAAGPVQQTPGAPLLPRDELLRYVPDDAGFCLVVQNLRRHLTDLAASPLAGHWLKSGPAQTLLASPEWQQLRRAERHLARHLGIGLSDLRDDLLGEAFVFVYRPGPGGKPEEEQGLFLVRGRNEKTLAALIERLNAVQQQTGELTSLEEREHRGIRYLRRVETRTTNYYLLRGPVLLFTAQEGFLRDALDQYRRSPADTEPLFARRLRELRQDQALAALVVNPRAWDAAITAKGVADPGTRTFAAFWKALEGGGIALHLDREVRLSLALRASPATLPEAARRFLTAAGQPSELWSSFPEDALLAVGGRFDLASLYEFLGTAMTRAGRETLEADLERTVGAVLGRDVIKEVLPALGPDWGICLRLPVPGEKQLVPPGFVAVRVARGEESAPIDEAVLSAVQTGAQLAVLAHNSKHPTLPLRLRWTALERGRGRYFQGDGFFPTGVQPAFALRSGYLVLASSPAELARFRPGKPVAASGGKVPLLRMSLRSWRAYLAGRREALATALETRSGLGKDRALVKLEELLASLELLDRLELSQQSAPGFVSFTLAIEPAVPLRK